MFSAASVSRRNIDIKRDPAECNNPATTTRIIKQAAILLGHDHLPQASARLITDEARQRADASKTRVQALAEIPYQPD